jgi:hypothetical protein
VHGLPLTLIVVMCAGILVRRCRCRQVRYESLAARVHGRQVTVMVTVAAVGCCRAVVPVPWRFKGCWG